MPAGKRTIALRACALLSAATSARAGGAGNAPMVGDDHGSGGGGALSHVFSAKIEMACAGEMMCFIVLFVLVFEVGAPSLLAATERHSRACDNWREIVNSAAGASLARLLRRTCWSACTRKCTTTRRTTLFCRRWCVAVVSTN